jgi:hypothetical protein
MGFFNTGRRYAVAEDRRVTVETIVVMKGRETSMYTVAQDRNSFSL